MALGLERGSVRLVTHQPGWAAAYRAAAEGVASVLADVRPAPRIAHVGATAVPGLPAKPIIDIAVGVADLAVVSECVAPLAGLGYTYLGDRAVREDHLFVRGPEHRRTVYLHIVHEGGEKWNAYLRFRDRLRADPELRDRYAEIKRDLARRYADHRPAYTAGKAAIIEEILGRPSGAAPTG